MNDNPKCAICGKTILRCHCGWGTLQQRIAELEAKVEEAQRIKTVLWSLTGTLWPQNETTRKLEEVIEDWHP